MLAVQGEAGAEPARSCCCLSVAFFLVFVVLGFVQRDLSLRRGVWLLATDCALWMLWGRERRVRAVSEGSR